LEKGSNIKSIIGVKPYKIGDKENVITALVSYEDGVHELVPTEVVAQFAPKVIVDFYEARLRLVGKDGMGGLLGENKENL
jgi:hypothetical protein